MKIKLSKWAKNNGLTYQTAWNLFKAGKLPVKAYQLATKTIIVDLEDLSIENLLNTINISCEQIFGETVGKEKADKCKNIIISNE